MVAGWVRRKVKNSDKWVRRWLEVNRHVLRAAASRDSRRVSVRTATAGGNRAPPPASRDRPPRYSYQACPTDTPSARVMNMLDLRKTREIKVVDGGDFDGLFLIVPESADNEHPGYMMRADSRELAQEWVAGLNKARKAELDKIVSMDKARRPSESICCCFFGKPSKSAEERASLVRG